MNMLSSVQIIKKPAEKLDHTIGLRCMPITHYRAIHIYHNIHSFIEYIDPVMLSILQSHRVCVETIDK